MIVGILMAGGKGSRLNLSVEKPLLKFNNKPLIDYSLKNFDDSKVDNVIVALSPHTQDTRLYLESIGIGGFDDFKSNVSYIVTPGDGYLKDYNFILDFLEEFSKSNVVVFLNCDLPFVFGSIIDDVLDVYFDSLEDALSVFLSVDIFKSFNLDFEFEFNGLVPVGLNIVRSENIVQSQKDLILDIGLLAFNINTVNNMKIALKLLQENDIFIV